MREETRHQQLVAIHTFREPTILMSIYEWRTVCACGTKWVAPEIECSDKDLATGATFGYAGFTCEQCGRVNVFEFALGLATQLRGTRRKRERGEGNAQVQFLRPRD